MAKEIRKAAEALGISIHDHLVIGGKGHASFRSLGLLARDESMYVSKRMLLIKLEDMSPMLRSALVLALFAPLAACAQPPRAASSGQDLAITVRLQNAKLDFTKNFVHRSDADHRCVQPGRIRLPTAAIPRSEEPPNHAAGYAVVFGPDPSTPERGGSTVPMGGVVPGLPPLDNPVVNYFSLQIEPLPDQLLASGAVRLSRSFSIGLTARSAWEGRFAEGDPKTPGSVTLDPDGLGGRFHLTGVEPHLAHGRMAPSEYVTATGSWRCPSG